MPAHNKSLVSLQPLWGLVSSCPHFETWTRYCPQCFLGTRISPTKSILHHVWCLRICQSIIIRASEWNIHAALAISKCKHTRQLIAYGLTTPKNLAIFSNIAHQFKPFRPVSEGYFQIIPLPLLSQHIQILSRNHKIAKEERKNR